MRLSTRNPQTQTLDTRDSTAHPEQQTINTEHETLKQGGEGAMRLAGQAEGSLPLNPNP